MRKPDVEQDLELHLFEVGDLILSGGGYWIRIGSINKDGDTLVLEGHEIMSGENAVIYGDSHDMRTLGTYSS